MQIKTMRRSHFTPIRMTVIKKWKITSVGKDVENLNSCTLLVDNVK